MAFHLFMEIQKIEFHFFIVAPIVYLLLFFFYCGYSMCPFWFGCGGLLCFGCVLAFVYISIFFSVLVPFPPCCRGSVQLSVEFPDNAHFYQFLNREPYMSAHVLLNLLNELGKRKKARLASHFISFSQQV